MIALAPLGQCCGCSACEQVCPHSAIKMKADALGFLYPEIDSELCTECGLCSEICSAGKPVFKKAPEAFAVRHKNPAEVSGSRSGAAFVALSDVVLENGGVVFGAAFAEDFSVEHREASSKIERNAFRGSKYVQSAMGDVFSQVKQRLREGRTVLFSGTPCQCNALRSFLGADSYGLILVDFVCHGVPSPAVWKSYLELRKSRKDREIVRVDFRNKTDFGWKDHRETIWYDDGSKQSSRSFTSLYYSHSMLRPCCYECEFNTLDRCTDLTLGDLWGWEKMDPGLNSDDLGYSLVLVNTAKGAKLFESARPYLNCREADMEYCLQRPLKERVSAHPEALSFETLFINGGVEAVLRKFGDWNFRSRFGYLYKFLRKKARKFLRLK